MPASTPEQEPGSPRPDQGVGDALPVTGDLAEPAYREAVIDLLGVIAYGEVSACERLAEDAKLAPTVADKIELLRLSSKEFSHLETLQVRLRELGADPEQAMAPFARAIEEFHAHTAPADWYEGLVKAYVGDGLAADFYREVAAFLDARSREVVVAALADAGHAQFVVDRVREAMAADPRLGGRLALWGRRLMGEALVQGQRVAAERESLAGLLSGGAAGLDLTAIALMFHRITEAHTARMDALGLDS